MARKLKGTVTQTLPSWNLKRMAGTAFGGGNVNFGDIWASGLLNNAADGSWLVVWDVQLSAVSAGAPPFRTIIDVALMHGRTGSFFADQPNFPLASETPALPGIGWGDIPSSEQGGIFLSISIQNEPYKWNHDWPFCAIAPGDSVVAYSDANAYIHFGAQWIYEVVPGGL